MVSTANEKWRMIVNNHSPFTINYLPTGLLNFNFSTGFFQFGNQSFSICFANTFLNGFRCAVNQVLGFFQSEAGQVFHDLHDIQFICTSGFQNNIKRCFFFSSRSSSTGSGTGNSYSCSSGFDTILFFQDFCEFIYFFYSQGNQLFCE